MIFYGKLAKRTPGYSSALFHSLARVNVNNCADFSKIYGLSRPSNLFQSCSVSDTKVLLTDFSEYKCGRSLSSLSFSTVTGTVLVQARDPGKLSEQLEAAIDECRLSDAWSLHEQFMHMEGFPRKSIVNKLVASSVESSDVQWLEKACELFEQALEGYKLQLFEKETLFYLSLGLARNRLPVPSSTILRKLIEVGQFPPVNAWATIIAYMSQTSPGAYIAAELVLEIGFLFQDGRVDSRKKCNEPLIAMKPNALSFSIALVGCLIFNTTRKAEQLLDMIPRIGLKTDATLSIIMAHIYEKNGRREELKNLERQIGECYDVSDTQYLQFHNCLLSCHLKLGDLESSSQMVLDMLHKAKKAQNSIDVTKLLVDDTVKANGLLPGDLSLDGLNRERPVRLESLTSFLLLPYESFCRDRKFLKLVPEAKELLNVSVSKFKREVELITAEHGILQPTEKLYVILVKAFLEVGKTKDLAEFLIKVQKEMGPTSADDSALVHVINSCISLGLLEQAHDLLDEMRLAGIRTGSSVYSDLLKAYCKANQPGEITSLLRDARRAGVQLDASCYDALMESRVLQKDTQGALSLFKEMKEAKLQRGGHQKHGTLVRVRDSSKNGEPDMMAKLLLEIKDGQKNDCGVHDWNNVIHFFCKKRLMQDAENALKKMRSLGHFPNVQTFHSMVMGYAAIGSKYNEVADLWGQMKSLAFSSRMKFDQELLDGILYTFVRGGFFVRANEVVEILEKGNMFVDKYKYRTLFLKYHKTLYKGKAPKFQTESQMQRREAALNFKKWVGLD